MLDELYFDGTHETERGAFAVICAHGIDGNVCDVYGETKEEAEQTAKELIALVERGKPRRLEDYPLQGALRLGEAHNFFVEMVPVARDGVEYEVPKVFWDDFANVIAQRDLWERRANAQLESPKPPLPSSLRRSKSTIR